MQNPFYKRIQRSTGRQRRGNQWWITLALLWACMLVHLPIAQAEVENDMGQWTQINLNKSFTPKVKGIFEVQPRLKDGISEMDQLLVRPYVGYQVTQNLSLWLGYGWITQYDPEFIHEHRIFQQSLYERNLSRLHLTLRNRLEQRFLEGVSSPSIRTRSMIRAFYPLDKQNKWGLVGYNELFFVLNSVSDGPDNGFDQNRTILAISRELSKSTRMEAGYLLQYVNRPSPTDDRLNHVIFILLNVNL